jgi:hypothetical protein
MWSNLSVKSEYVKLEAREALEQNKLVPIRIDSVNLPMRYKGVHTLSLLGWDGSKDFSEFRKLVEDISQIVARTRTERQKGQSVGRQQSVPESTDKLYRRAVEIIPNDQLAKELSGKNSAIFEVLERNAPKFSDAEIGRIADDVSRILMERYLDTLAPQKRAASKERIRKIVYDIGIGLVNSGIWAALVYAASKMGWLADPEKTKYQIKKDRRMDIIRAKLAEGLSREEADDLNFITEALDSRIASPDQLSERLLHTEDFQEFLREVKQEDTRVGAETVTQEEFIAWEFVSEVINPMYRYMQDQIVPPVE